MRESAAQGSLAEGNGAGSAPGEHVSFSDVARAHFQWDVATEGAKRTEAREDFHAKLSKFERQSGVVIVDAYWCQREASAVALARAEAQGEHRPGHARRFLRRDETPDFRLYRVTDWVTGDMRKLADLLHDCDVLAIKAIWGLDGIQRAVVMQWLLSVEAHILGFLETDWRRAERATQRQEQSAPELDRLYRRVLAELNQIESYYQEAGMKHARLRYVQGMLLLGLPAVVVAALVFGVVFQVFGLMDFYDESVRTFFACMAAGAIGAIMSVLVRMRRDGGFVVDHELGAAGVMQLGAYRPLIGAVFGIVISLLVQTFLVPIDSNELSFELFVVVAFLAGFSERWAKVVLGGAMRTVHPDDDAVDQLPSPPTAPPPAPA